MTVVALGAGVVTASCVKVLDLADHASAAQALCALLDRCFGSSEYPGCREHVESGLGDADAAARAEWLGNFAGALHCLDTCSDAKRCLDQLPVCNQASDGCGQAEHCCGFLDGLASCAGQGTCCKPDGRACSTNAECCEGECDVAQGTCGGERPCVNAGESCEVDEDCCSLNCIGSVCAMVCKHPGENCSDAAECCSGLCNGTSCECRGSASPCTLHGECCSQLCDPLSGTCAEPMMCGVLHDPCNLEGDCCAPAYQCGPALTCCQGQGVGCLGPDACCTGTCEKGLCCAGYQQPCSTTSDCCFGNCNSLGGCDCGRQGDSCVDSRDCCGGLCVSGSCAATCPHSVCCTGEALSPTQMGSNGCPLLPGQATCVQAICMADPFCCDMTNGSWDWLCVDKVKTLCPNINCVDVACEIVVDPMQ